MQFQGFWESTRDYTQVVNQYSYNPVRPGLKDECPVDTLRACVFIYLPYILKNNVEFWRK